MPAFSTRNSTEPDLADLTALPHPASPCRLSGSASGCADRAPYRDGRPAASCPAWRWHGRNRSRRPGPFPPGLQRRRCRHRLPWLLQPLHPREHGNANVTAGAARQETTPRTIWSAWRGSTPRFIGDLDRFVELGLGPFLHQLDSFSQDGVCLVAVNAFGRRACALSLSP
jgi:hypothetical protein